MTPPPFPPSRPPQPQEGNKRGGGKGKERAVDAPPSEVLTPAHARTPPPRRERPAERGVDVTPPPPSPPSRPPPPQEGTMPRRRNGRTGGPQPGRHCLTRPPRSLHLRGGPYVMWEAGGLHHKAPDVARTASGRHLC